MMKRVLSFAISVFLMAPAITANCAEVSSQTILDERPVVYPDSIYDQESVISKKDFLKLSPEEQNKKLEDLLLRNKRIYLAGNLLKVLKYPLLGAAAVLATTYTDWYKKITNASIEKFAEENPLAVLMGASAGSMATTLILAIIGREIGTTVSHFDGYGSTRFMQEIEKKYIHQKRFYQKDLQKAIEGNFATLRRLKDVSNQNYEMVKLAVELPYKIKELSFDKEKLDTSLKYYSPQVKEKMIIAANHEYITQEIIAKKGNLQRKSIYLVGPPGVGKTLAVSKFAESLGLPFVRISLEGRSVDDLIGRSIKSNDISEGIIANQIIEKTKSSGINAKNMVIFLDEVDHALMDKRYAEEILAFLLKLLDPESKSLYNPFFEANIDTSQWTIMLAGNHKLDNAALSNRMNYIYFDGFSKGAKKDLLWNHFMPNIIKTYNNIVPQKDITEEEINMINASIDSDMDPGLRTIQQFAIDFIEYKIAEKNKTFKLGPFNGKEKMEEFNQFLDEYKLITNIKKNTNNVEEKIANISPAA